MGRDVKDLGVISLTDRPSEGIIINYMKPYWEEKYGIKLNKVYK